MARCCFPHRNANHGSFFWGGVSFKTLVSVPLFLKKCESNFERWCQRRLILNVLQLPPPPQKKALKNPPFGEFGEQSDLVKNEDQIFFSPKDAHENVDKQRVSKPRNCHRWRNHECSFLSKAGAGLLVFFFGGGAVERYRSPPEVNKTENGLFSG